MQTSSFHVVLNGRKVPVTSDNKSIITRRDVSPSRPLHPGQVHLSTLIRSKLFLNWLSTIDPSFFVLSITVKAVTMCGPRPGFMHIEAHVFDCDGNTIPGAAFLRGNSVAILIELVCEGERYALLIRQPRFPAGQVLTETPAGMLDDCGDFRGAAFKELVEEVPALNDMFKIDEVELLSDMPVWMSPGGCDEQMMFYYLRVSVSRSTIATLNGSMGGLENEGERTKAVVVLWKDLGYIPDAKLQIAVGLYNMKFEIPFLQGELERIMLASGDDNE